MLFFSICLSPHYSDESYYFLLGHLADAKSSETWLLCSRGVQQQQLREKITKVIQPACEVFIIIVELKKNLQGTAFFCLNWPQRTEQCSAYTNSGECHLFLGAATSPLVQWTGLELTTEFAEQTELSWKLQFNFRQLCNSGFLDQFDLWNTVNCTMYHLVVKGNAFLSGGQGNI